MNVLLNSFAAGLTTAEAKRGLEKYGQNVLPEKPPPSAWMTFFKQFKSPLVYVLLFAFATTTLFQEYSDAIIILFALLINTLLGFYQEARAQKDFFALSKILTSQARVIRDKREEVIDSRELVPGDLVILEIGDKVPADGELLTTVDLAMSEAVLTGESASVRKKEKDFVFMGTMVEAGRGVMLVKQTGRSTKMGQIAVSLKEEEEPTPLEKRLAALARTLALLVGVIASLMFLLGIVAGESIKEMFTNAVALAVAAIPEGLVISLTVILAVGMQRILKRKALVRNLASAETLGSVTVICTDKTGTLTEGKMRVVADDFTDRELGLAAGILCNNLRDPLELAMWDWALRSAQGKTEDLKSKYPRLDEIPFSPVYKFIATLHRKIIFLSGAPELLLSWSRLGEEERRSWEKKLKNFADKGLRLVGFALVRDGDLKKEFQKLKEKKTGKDFSNIIFLGILVYEDPVRPSVAQTIEECWKAGVKVKVITGDHVDTSVAVLKKLGIKVTNEEIMEGGGMEKISEKELKEKIGKVILFARINPMQKLKIVSALKENGEVVAMMGDGVNDALALQKADIGIVVRDASAVAQETADMVLLDSNFKTIVAAIEEGRGIFDNLKKIILYLMADAFNAILIVLGALLIGFPLPLSAGQILWINLISDGFPALALTVDPKRKDLMQEPPIDPKETLLSPDIKMLIFLLSLTGGLYTLFLFWFFLNRTGDLALARSVAFALLGTQSLFYVFSCRSPHRPVWSSELFSNRWLVLGVGAGFLLLFLAFYLPPLASLLHTVPLGATEWLIVIAMGFAVVCFIEALKLIFVLKSKV